MTKPFSVAFKQKMVQRLTGKKAVSASQLAREAGVRQQNLSRWLQEARSLPTVANKPKLAVREWTVEQKARVLAEASQLDGEKLTAARDRIARRPRSRAVRPSASLLCAGNGAPCPVLRARWVSRCRRCRACSPGRG